MNHDADLLRRYAEDHSESAFTELVRRHIGLVYGAALRRTGDAHAAADVAQQVFTTLARDARKLARHAVLSAWLHTATRNAALNLMISEHRRRAREHAAAESEMAGGSPEWERIRPVLDAAIDELPERDRAAVVLRYLERRPFAEIGAVLRVTEDAARMRTDRALEKLREILARRGIDSTAAAFGIVVTSHPVIAAPAGLAASVASAALASAAAGAGWAGLLGSLMSPAFIAPAFVCATAAFIGGAYFGVQHASHAPLPPPPELPQHTRTIASLRQDNQRLQAELESARAAHAKLVAERAAAARPAPAPAAAPVPATSDPAQIATRQRAMLNNLRQIAAARDQFFLEYGRPPASIDELVGETKYIRRLNPVAGESYALLPMMHDAPMTVTSPDGITVTYDPKGPNTTNVPARQAVALTDIGRRMEPLVARALEAYRAAHAGRHPPTPEALLPYFATPQEGADFVEALEAEKAARR